MSWLLISMCIAQAQVSMTLQVPPTGVLMKNQLWNMLLVNGGAGQLVRVNLVLLDVKNNQPVLTAASAPLTLGKGVHQLQAKDLSPIQYVYTAPASRVDMDPNGMLPAGTYQVCYSVVNVEKGSLTLIENCIPLNIDPMSPPLLNTPADGELLNTPYPQFTWLPPTPLGIFNDLSYDMVLVEVLPGQGKADAVQQNVPVYTIGRTRNQYMNYPASYRSLDTSKLYAWRIVALNNGQAVALSDIWSFRVASNKPVHTPQPDGAYISVKRGLDATVISSGNVLRFTYDNVAADTSVHYTITALEDPGNPVIQEGDVKLKYGTNLLQVTIQKVKGFASGKVYLFRFANSRQETWSVKFSWTPSDNNKLNRNNP